MLMQQHRREALSRAFVHAIAADVGLSCSIRDFDYGIDITLHDVTVRTHPISRRRRFVESGVGLDIQLKSTINVAIDKSSIYYDLSAQAFADLCELHLVTPRVLVLHVQPASEKELVEFRADGLRIGGTCYWHSLRGESPKDNRSSQRVQIPLDNQFTSQTLRGLMNRIKAGGFP